MKTKKLLSFMLAIVMVVSMTATLGITASAAKAYTLTYDSSEYGTFVVKVNNGTEIKDFNSGSMIDINYSFTVKTTPDTGYEVDSVKINGTDATKDSENNYSFDFQTLTLPNSTLVVTFKVSQPTDECYLDLESSTTDILDSKTLDQNYNLTVLPVVSGNAEVTKVKVTWNITDINAVRMDKKVWDTTELKWVDAAGTPTVMNNGTAEFKFENYSSIKVNATVSFTALTGFNPTVEYGTAGSKITIDTANGNNTYSKTNVPTGTINVTVKPGEDDFEGKSATTAAAKYGTYTVTLSEPISAHFVSTISGAYKADGTVVPDGFVVDSANKTITIKDEEAFLYYGLVYNAANADQMTAKLDADLDLNNLVIANGFTCKTNFDGQNHTIKNLIVNGAANGSAGFFREILVDSVKNLVLDHITVNGAVSTGNSCFGILAGEANTNTIENVTVKNSSVSNGKFTGGLVGFAYAHNITGCSVIDTTISCQYKCGGIVGYTCMECVNPADDYSNITGNTVKNVTINCANLLEGKNHYETGKVVGDWNAPTGTYTGNTVNNVTIVNGSVGYTDNEIGAIESSCSINYGEPA